MTPTGSEHVPNGSVKRAKVETSDAESDASELAWPLQPEEVRLLAAWRLLDDDGRRQLLLDVDRRAGVTT
jgi:hypothetical protein